jgi:hypothetical protein
MDVVVAGHLEQFLWLAGHLEQFFWLVVRPRVSRIGVPGGFCGHFASMRAFGRKSVAWSFLPDLCATNF